MWANLEHSRTSSVPGGTPTVAYPAPSLTTFPKALDGTGGVKRQLSF